MSSRISPVPQTALTISVAVLILGAGFLGSAALAGSFTLLVAGLALVVAALAATVALTRPPHAGDTRRHP